MLNVPLVFAIDAGFFMPLNNALLSLAKAYVEHNPLPIHVLHSDSLTKNHISALQETLASNPYITLRVHSVSKFSPDLDAEINNAAYLRLAIPGLFKKYKRVIYLDADIVFIKSPSKFTEINLGEGMVIAACQDIQNPTLGSGIALPGWDKLGLSAEQEYFNSGVMIIDPVKWLDARITEKVIDFVQSTPEHLRFRDQDALNFLLKDQWEKLSHTWNYPPLSAILQVPGAKYYAEKYFPLKDMLAGESSAAIFHFVGPDKPWNDSFPAGDIADLYRSLTS